MTLINEHTTIAKLLKKEPAALDAIVSLSSRFNLLKNPVMRRLMAGRTSIATATRIGGVTLQSFFDKLAPYGFIVEKTAAEVPVTKIEKPAFMESLTNEQLIELDVRPILASGKDPLRNIQDAIIEMKVGQVLRIINSFEPSPLIQLYAKKGFEAYVDNVNEKLVHTYLYRTNAALPKTVAPVESDDWDSSLLRFLGRTQTIDVRMMEMPKPMLTILDSLDSLPEENALLVLHKRVPVFLLPHLEERQLEYRVKKTAGEEIQMLIYRC